MPALTRKHKRPVLCEKKGCHAPAHWLPAISLNMRDSDILIVGRQVPVMIYLKVPICGSCKPLITAQDFVGHPRQQKIISQSFAVRKLAAPDFRTATLHWHNLNDFALHPSKTAN